MPSLWPLIYDLSSLLDLFSACSGSKRVVHTLIVPYRADSEAPTCGGGIDCCLGFAGTWNKCVERRKGSRSWCTHIRQQNYREHGSSINIMVMAVLYEHSWGTSSSSSMMRSILSDSSCAFLLMSFMSLSVDCLFSSVTPRYLSPLPCDPPWTGQPSAVGGARRLYVSMKNTQQHVCSWKGVQLLIAVVHLVLRQPIGSTPSCSRTRHSQ